MASLLTWLAVSGHRKSDGTPNASGSALIVNPGSSAAQVVFSNAEETGTITQPVPLDAAGKATVYTNGPVDIIFQDSLGAALETKSLPNVVESSLVSVDPAAFTGPYLSDAGTAALNSFGGVDFQYLAAPGGTALSVGSVLTGIQVSVKSFGAKGDGLAIDTTAIQAAINFVVSKGGGVVYFPPGTYLIDASLSMSAAVSGVTFSGAGQGSSIIKQTGGALNVFTLSNASNTTIQNLGFAHTSSSTGAVISCSAMAGVVVNGISIAAGAFRTGASFSNCTSTLMANSTLRTVASAGAGRCLVYTTGGGPHFVTNSTISPTGTDTGIEFATGNSLCSVVACHFFGGLRGVLVTSSDNNDLIRVIGCSGLSSNVSTPFSDASGGNNLLQVHNGINASSAAVISGGTVTPSPSLNGPYLYVTATTTGVAYVVAAPLMTLPQLRGTQLTIRFFNNAGGAVTGWTLNPIYKITATPISVNNLDQTTIVFTWDGTNWRETSRVVTT